MPMKKGPSATSFLHKMKVMKAYRSRAASKAESAKKSTLPRMKFLSSIKPLKTSKNLQGGGFEVTLQFDDGYRVGKEALEGVRKLSDVQVRRELDVSGLSKIYWLASDQELALGKHPSLVYTDGRGFTAVTHTHHMKVGWSFVSSKFDEMVMDAQ